MNVCIVYIGRVITLQKDIPVTSHSLGVSLTFFVITYDLTSDFFKKLNLPLFLLSYFYKLCIWYLHTCDISRFRRELPIWSLSSRSHARETKPPDERFFHCHFSRTVFQSEHFIVYGSIYLAKKLFTAQKCLTFIDLIDDH